MVAGNVDGMAEVSNQVSVLTKQICFGGKLQIVHIRIDWDELWTSLKKKKKSQIGLM